MGGSVECIKLGIDERPGDLPGAIASEIEEDDTVTVLYRDGGTSSNPLVGPYIIEPDDYFE